MDRSSNERAQHRQKPAPLEETSRSRNPSDHSKSPLLRPDINSHINHLLMHDYEQQPTTQFVDSLLTRTYPDNSDRTVDLVDNQQQQGPISQFYQQPYSISPNNVFQSIVITQLNPEIRSRDDIDIQVIRPNELHLIATAKNMPFESNEARIRSRSLGHIALRFNRDNSIPQVSELHSIECQTDAHLDPFYVKQCNPTLAEMENLSFSYAVDENERLIRLNHMVNDTYDEYLASQYVSDPCSEFEHYLRGDGTGKPQYTKIADTPRKAEGPLSSKSTTGTQTFYTTTPSLHNSFSQTTPSLERKSFRKPVETQTSTTGTSDSSTQSTPDHQIKTNHTITVPKNNLGYFKDSLHIKSKSKTPKDLHYAHLTEYSHDLVPGSHVHIQEKPKIVHESLVVALKEPEPKEDKRMDRKDKAGSSNRARSASRGRFAGLSHSSIEVTTVLGSTTTVTGITGALDSEERFSMSVDYPSPLKNDSDTDTLDGNSPDTTVSYRDEAPNYPPPRPPVSTVPIVNNMRNLIRSPPSNSVSPTEANKKPLVTPKSQLVATEETQPSVPPKTTKSILAKPRVSPRATPTPIEPPKSPTTDSVEVPSYPETTYDINNLPKRKPHIIECKDEKTDLPDADIVLPPAVIKRPIPPKSVQTDNATTVNLIPSIVKSRGPKPPPAFNLLNKPTPTEVKQSFIEKVANLPVDNTDGSVSNNTSKQGPTPEQAQHAQQQQPLPSLSSGEKVLPVPVGKQQSFKSRLQAGGFQTNQPNQAQPQKQQQNVSTQQPRSPGVPQDRIKQIQQRIQQQKQEQNKPQPMLPPRQQQPQQPVRPVSRTSLETASKFDMYDYEENYDIDLNIYDKNNKKLMNSSKINSFNDTNSDIIDIDFEQYDQEIETPTERLENADSDGDSKRVLKHSSPLNSKSTNNDLFFDSYNESKTDKHPQSPDSSENYIITEISDEVLSTGSLSGSNLNRPLVSSTSPSPQPNVTQQNSRPPMKKLFNDWNTLLNDGSDYNNINKNNNLLLSESARVQTASSSLTFGVNTINPTGHVSRANVPNSKQNPVRNVNDPANNGRFEQTTIRQPNINTNNNNNNQRLAPTNLKTLPLPIANPAKSNSQVSKVSNDTGIEADVDDRQQIAAKIMPQPVNKLQNLRQLQLQQFQQKQNQLQGNQPQQQQQQWVQRPSIVSSQSSPPMTSNNQNHERFNAQRIVNKFSNNSPINNQQQKQQKVGPNLATATNQTLNQRSNQFQMDLIDGQQSHTEQQSHRPHQFPTEPAEIEFINADSSTKPTIHARTKGKVQFAPGQFDALQFSHKSRGHSEPTTSRIPATKSKRAKTQSARQRQNKYQRLSLQIESISAGATSATTGKQTTTSQKAREFSSRTTKTATNKSEYQQELQSSIKQWNNNADTSKPSTSRERILSKDRKEKQVDNSTLSVEQQQQQQLTTNNQSLDQIINNNNNTNINKNTSSNMIIFNNQPEVFNNTVDITAMKNKANMSRALADLEQNLFDQTSISKTIGTDASSYMGLPEKFTPNKMPIKSALKNSNSGNFAMSRQRAQSLDQSNESLAELIEESALVEDYIQEMTQSQHLARIVRLMNSTAQREFEKMLRRIERRKVRVPEILAELKTSKGKQSKKLEDELRLLMRKSERDNLMLQRALQMAHTEGPMPATRKKLVTTKRTFSKQNHSTGDLHSSSQTSINRSRSAENREKNTDQEEVAETGKEAQKPTVSFASQMTKDKRRFAKESSGYSSESHFEDSTHEINNSRFNRNSSCDDNDLEPVSEIADGRITPKIDEIPRRPLYKEASTKSVENSDNELEDLSFNSQSGSLYIPIEQTVGTAHGTYGRQQANGDGASGSGGARQQSNRSNSNNNSSSNNRNQRPGSNQGGSNAGSNNENSGNNGNNRGNGNNNKRGDEAEGFRIEYINESDLGDNYEENYQVEHDEQTGEFYILDYEKRIKFVIVMDKLGHNLQNHEANGNNAVDSLATPHKATEEVIDGGIDDSFGQYNQQLDQQTTIMYVQESDLNEVDLSNAEVYDSEGTGEQIIFNHSDPSQQWVVLPNDWRESQLNNYLAADEIDTTNLDVFTDEASQRRYIVDEDSNDRYYLIEAATLTEEFKKRWLYLAELSRNNGVLATDTAIGDADDLLVDSGIESDYIEEAMLDGIELEGGEIVEDELTGEAVLFHPSRPNTRWIVLPNDWQTSNESPYVNEADAVDNNWETLEDEATGRRYILDEKSQQRFYVVNPDKIKQSEFMAKWSKIVADSKLAKNGKPGVTFDRNTKIPHDLMLDLDSASMKNFEREPSNLYLRTTAMNSPDRVITPNSRSNSKNLYNTLNAVRMPIHDRILIQPGHMEQLMPKDITYQAPPTPITNRHGKPLSGKEHAARAALELKKTIQQQTVLRSKQESARRAFLSRKMPGMSKLWLHQQLLNESNRRRDLRHRITASMEKRRREEANALLDHTGKHWKGQIDTNDPTADKDGLNREKLLALQVNGYNRFDKKFMKKYKNDFAGKEFDFDDYWKYCSTLENSPADRKIGMGGGDQTFVRGLLTENFRRHNDYVVKQMNSHMKALVPKERLELKQQYLLTPRYLQDGWEKQLNRKPNKMQPRIILINDDERIITAKKNCNVYVQYIHENDGVIGADPMYQFMLPDCGPTKPSRPLLITPRHIKSVSRHLPNPPAEMALREAPVFVYHQEGSQFFENIAQYLAGRQPKLSPKTVRKILQFADMKEFEEYLASKLTREEALKISELSGNSLVNVDAMKHDLHSNQSIITGTERTPRPTDKYYHFGCEYDPLRTVEDNLSVNSVDLSPMADETQQIEINNQVVKSTFIGYNPKGESEEISYDDLPVEMVRALQQPPKNGPIRNQLLGLQVAPNVNAKRLIPKM